MRHLSSIAGVDRRVVDSIGQDRSRGGRITKELVRDQPPRPFPLAGQDLAEEACRGSSVAAPLHKDLEHVAVLVHGSPQIVLLPGDLDEYFVNVPSVAELAFATLQRPLIARPERQAPAANGLVRDLDPALGKKVFNIAETQAESSVEPDRVADDLRREPVPVVL